MFAYGLRHPFRAGFDRANGDLYVGDVGSRQFEEINVIPAGAAGLNFGWRVREGFTTTPFGVDDEPPENAVDPLYAYPNTTGAAVIGGLVYRGSAIPDLVGDYLFADFVGRDLFTFTPDVSPVTEVIDRTVELRNPSDSGFIGLVNFFEDGDGEVYFLDFIRGDVFRIVQGLYGDYNADGVVDVSDYEVWRDSFGQSDDLRADGNRDGIVDIADFTIWRDGLAQQLAVLNAVNTPVPEPASVACLALLAAFGACRQRRG